jgi:flagellin-like protein
MMKKKALSPVITTILLVLLAIVLAAIILLWARGFIKETPLKFDSSLNEDRPIQELCDKVRLEFALSGNDLSINNIGAIPVNKIQVIASAGGSSSNDEYEINLNSGDSKSLTSTVDLNGKKVEIVPILLGKLKSGPYSPYTCLNNKFLAQ